MPLKFRLLLVLAAVWFVFIQFSSKVSKNADPAMQGTAANTTANTTRGTPLEVGQGTQKTPTSDRLVLSLTTLPGRILFIQPTLDSLLFQQTYKADQLYLVLPEQPAHRPPYVIPDFVQNYSDHGYLTILRTDHDFGAIDKIIHTLPVEEQIFQQQSTLQAHQFRILYLDDDMIYHPKTVEVLVAKGDQYPNDAVALSGANLRSRFRQIGHTNNPQTKNRHPYLYFWIGGLDSHGDTTVDIVQGFTGVLVRLSFFNVVEFVRVAGNMSVPEGVRRSDDFVLSAYLERRRVTRRCVDGGLLLPIVPNPIPAGIQNLGKTMHQNAMTAAHYLQQEWGIWSQYQFEPYLELPQHIRDLTDCESNRAESCPAHLKDAEGKPLTSNVTQLLDAALHVT